MRLLIQECLEGSVTISGKVVSSIQNGEVIFVGFTQGDNEEILDKRLAKRIKLRIFKDAEGKTNLSLSQVNGQVLCVSQFTLYADISKGNRPSFQSALKGDEAKILYECFCKKLSKYVEARFGVFGEDRKVRLINDGPFTIFMDSKEICK